MKCPTCQRILDEEKKGTIISIVPQRKIPELSLKKKPNFQGIELMNFINQDNNLNQSQSISNIDAPLLIPMPKFNNLENINLNENENRENSVLNITMFILYSILLIYMTVLFRNHGGFSLTATSSLYILIIGLFVVTFTINVRKLLNK